MGRKKDKASTFFSNIGLDTGPRMNKEQIEYLGKQRERVKRKEITVAEAKEDWFKKYYF